MTAVDLVPAITAGEPEAITPEMRRQFHDACLIGLLALGRTVTPTATITESKGPRHGIPCPEA